MSVFRSLAVTVMLLFFALDTYGAERITHCPAVDVEHNVFDASVLENNSRISVENGVAEYPLTLDFYRTETGGCEKFEFAKYSIEGGEPTVESIFFCALMAASTCFPSLHGV
ncbi:MAG: hypothetical protein V4801_16175 [Burkholderia gladioli]